MRNTPWRRWLGGPKHGIASGVAVFRSPGFDTSEHLEPLLARCEALRIWADDHGVDLSGDKDSLDELDRSMISWAEDPTLLARLTADAGLYVGTVIVGHVAGARWHAWPNDHPVVRLASGRDLDVTAIVSQRPVGGRPTLLDIYAGATAS